MYPLQNVISICVLLLFSHLAGGLNCAFSQTVAPSSGQKFRSFLATESEELVKSNAFVPAEQLSVKNHIYSRLIKVAGGAILPEEINEAIDSIYSFLGAKWNVVFNLLLESDQLGDPNDGFEVYQRKLLNWQTCQRDVSLLEQSLSTLKTELKRLQSRLVETKRDLNEGLRIQRAFEDMIESEINAARRLKGAKHSIEQTSERNRQHFMQMKKQVEQELLDLESRLHANFIDVSFYDQKLQYEPRIGKNDFWADLSKYRSSQYQGFLKINPYAENYSPTYLTEKDFYIELDKYRTGKQNLFDAMIYEEQRLGVAYCQNSQNARSINSEFVSTSRKFDRELNDLITQIQKAQAKVSTYGSELAEINRSRDRNTEDVSKLEKEICKTETCIRFLEQFLYECRSKTFQPPRIPSAECANRQMLDSWSSGSSTPSDTRPALRRPSH